MPMYVAEMHTAMASKRQVPGVEHTAGAVPPSFAPLNRRSTDAQADERSGAASGTVKRAQNPLKSECAPMLFKDSGGLPPGNTFVCSAPVSFTGDGTSSPLGLSSTHKTFTEHAGSPRQASGSASDRSGCPLSQRSAREQEALLGLLQLRRALVRRPLYAEKVKKTPLQMRVLQHVFNITRFPSSLTRNDLATLLAIPARSIQVWFQNTRQASRRLQARHPNFEACDDDEPANIPLATIFQILEDARRTLQ